MRRDCWVVLGIQKTKDISIIKNAYRELIKKYHPDTVQAPEKIRKYTIKCAEVIQAYKEAIDYAQIHQNEPEPIQANPKVPSSAQRQTASEQHKESANAFRNCIILCILFFFFSIVISSIIEVLGIYPVISNSMRFVFTCYDSMPNESILKMICSFPIALLMGALFNVVISIFTSAPVNCLWGALSDTKYEKHMYKLGYLIITALNISLVYYVPGLVSPFAHKANAYYAFLYHLCRFLAWSCTPIFLLAEWLIDNYKYLRVRDSVKSSDLVLYSQD